MEATSRRPQRRRRVVGPVLLALVAASLLPRPVDGVKLGKVAPKVWEDLEQRGLSEQEMEEAAAEAAAAAAEEEAAELARLRAAELAREALNRAKDTDWKATADRNKKERELDEKYGALKHVVLSPWFQWLMERVDDLLSIEVLGEPRMNPTAIVVLVYMLFKARQPVPVIGLLAAFFLNLHPLPLLLALAVGLSWARIRKPLGADPASPPPRTAPFVHPRHVSLNAKEMHAMKVLPGEVDHIVLGSDIGGLYAAALLSRVGHSVAVLEPGDSLGNCLHTLRGVEVDYGNHTTGMLHVYDELLRAGMPEGAKAPRWVQVGTEEDGFSFDVARVGNGPEVVYRMGRQALVDDQVTAAAADSREKIGGFVAKMEAVARESSGFFIGRLFGPRATRLLGAVLGQSYGQAGCRTVEQVLGANLPEYEDLDLLRGLFRHEGLLPTEASFAAYVSAMNHTFQGMHYPVGGLRRLAESLVPVIKASGGGVFHRAQVKSILLDDEGANGGSNGSNGGGGKGKGGMARATGVLLETGQTVRCRKSVLSALGVVPTLTHLLPKVPLGPGLEICEEARPRFVTLVLLKGSPDELDLPAQDYYQLPSADTAGGSLAWFHLSFPCAKDPDWAEPYSVAVVETEADDDVLEHCFRKPDGSGCTTRVPNVAGGDPPALKFYRPRPPSEAKLRRLQQGVTRKLGELFPQLEDRIDTEAGGIHTLGPFRVGLSHRPSRFAAPGLRAAVAAVPGGAGAGAAGVENVFLAGSDLVVGTFSGALLGGWLGAHVALGYGAADMLVLQRNLTGDLKNVPRPRMLQEGEEEHWEAEPSGGYERVKTE